MPLTPFAGFSVLVHVGVIVWNKLFGWMYKKPSKSKKKKVTTLAIQLFGMAIIGTVFLLELFIASSLLRASIIDKYSSINIVSGYVNKEIALAQPQPALAATFCLNYCKK